MSQRSVEPGQVTDAVVLCVDDDPYLLETVKLLLEKNGFAVLTAANGEQALVAFQTSVVDLVLVDHEMPGMHGDQVAAEIKKLNPGVPIVLHSGSLSPPQEALNTTDAFIRKGSETHLLVAVIARMIMACRVNRHHAS
jgi:CheY-like chemotaxis protein